MYPTRVINHPESIQTQHEWLTTPSLYKRIKQRKCDKFLQTVSF
jgi:hypothetical protein